MGPLLPPEWHRQDWLWIGFPHDASEWGDAYERAQEQVAAFASLVAESGQPVRLVVRDAANQARARALVSEGVALHGHGYGDIWLRDTGPLVILDENGERRAQRFGFNGWGGKYVMDGDHTIGADLAREAGLAVWQADWVLEGGAIDVDGAGLALTTEQCLLNPNRNPAMSREDIEVALWQGLGIERVVWLGEGLVNDHTDGHLDNLARFIGPRTVALPEPAGPDDPNAQVYADAAARIEAAGLALHRVPSPGRIERDGRVEPASYMNFVIANEVVVVPTFAVASDVAAVAAIDALFPGRRAIGSPADAVLAGGGGFHCASMQMPARTR